jgi:low temperature requirement protein LtrA
MIWLSSLLLPVPGRYGIWALVLLVEVITPMLAVSSAYREASYRPRVFHPEHIPERYGLFTLIVLGESVLAQRRGGAALLSSSYRSALSSPRSPSRPSPP